VTDPFRQVTLFKRNFDHVVGRGNNDDTLPTEPLEVKSQTLNLSNEPYILYSKS